jgi:hypothetical protein
MWTNASIGKTSTNGGVIDVPVRSWGIFVGVFGKGSMPKIRLWKNQTQNGVRVSLFSRISWLEPHGCTQKINNIFTCYQENF